MTLPTHYVRKHRPLLQERPRTTDMYIYHGPHSAIPIEINSIWTTPIFYRIASPLASQELLRPLRQLLWAHDKYVILFIRQPITRLLGALTLVPATLVSMLPINSRYFAMFKVQHYVLALFIVFYFLTCSSCFMCSDDSESVMAHRQWKKAIIIVWRHAAQHKSVKSYS